MFFFQKIEGDGQNISWFSVLPCFSCIPNFFVSPFLVFLYLLEEAWAGALTATHTHTHTHPPTHSPTHTHTHPHAHTRKINGRTADRAVPAFHDECSGRRDLWSSVSTLSLSLSFSLALQRSTVSGAANSFARPAPVPSSANVFLTAFAFLWKIFHWNGHQKKINKRDRYPL